LETSGRREPLGREAGVAELPGERLRKEAGVGSRDQFLRIGLDAVAESGTKRVRRAFSTLLCVAIVPALSLSATCQTAVAVRFIGETPW
jgi:hypothetical protein